MVAAAGLTGSAVEIADQSALQATAKVAVAALAQPEEVNPTSVNAGSATVAEMPAVATLAPLTAGAAELSVSSLSTSGQPAPQASPLAQAANLAQPSVNAGSTLSTQLPAGETVPAQTAVPAEPTLREAQGSAVSSLETFGQPAPQASPLAQAANPPQSEVSAGSTLSAQLPAGETVPAEMAVPAEPSVSSLETAGESADPADPMGQVTSVSQLSDVQPTDWAFQALQNLVERYGCIAGYPDGTFRGNRAMTRYEFAAGLNACLERIVQLIGPNIDTSQLITKPDLAAVQRLLEEFQAELATLRARTDVLEARTAELEANQFSTTTKLKGEVIFGANDIIGEGGTGVVPHLSYRARLNFDTSFTGKDLLRTRLQAGTTANLGAVDGTGVNMQRLGFEADTNSQFQLHKLFYRFPLTSKMTVILDANAAEFNDNVYVFNPLFESSGLGSISRFGRFNPIYRQGGGQGVTANFNFSKAFGISLGYQAPNGNDPEPVPDILNPSNDQGGGGFFKGSYAALGQATFRASDRLALGFTYVHSYSSNPAASRRGQVSGGTGSELANAPFGAEPTSANHYGLQATFSLSPRFVLSGWAGYSLAQSEISYNDAKIWNWAVTAAFPDLGKEGNVLGLMVGMPPKVTDNDVAGREDGDTSLHLEAFYRYQVTDNIAITPGLFVIVNPEHNENNETDYVGTIRTTFSF
ncbi:MAG: iron uptake porin [Oscillatoria princeps RMCB-10]|nr:iron uptake porin [Oscillatoria princeps RMCB-10]